MKYLFVLFLSWCGLMAEGQGIDVQKYKYELELRDGSDAITGNALVTVKFLVPASQFKLDLGSFDNEKGMQAFSVKEGEKMLRYTHSNDLLTVDLDKPAAVGDTRSFLISYMGTPRDGL